MFDFKCLGFRLINWYTEESIGGTITYLPLLKDVKTLNSFEYLV